MTCHESQTVLSAYQDGELAVERKQEVEQHLSECAACAAIFKRNIRLGEAIREQAPYYAPPDSLLAPKRRIPGWRSFGVGFATGLAAALAIVWFFMRSGSLNLTSDLVSDHVRSLMANHLIDVESSDRHTVKPWFLGKLDIAPSVPDLSGDGYPLVGGRLDYIRGHAAAALVYRKGQHVINVFVSSAKGAAGEENGYHIEHWQIGDLQYWAVSDVAREDLATFAKKFRQRASE